MTANTNRLLERSAPLPAIGRTGDADHTETMIFRVAAGVAHDDHMVAGLQRVTRHALTSELTACAPLHRVALHFALGILGFHLDERMRVAEQELNQLPFDFLGLIFEISCCE